MSHRTFKLSDTLEHGLCPRTIILIVASMPESLGILASRTKRFRIGEEGGENECHKAAANNNVLLSLVFTSTLESNKMFHAQRAVFVGVFLIAGLCTHSVIGQEKDGYSITGIVSNEKGEPVSDARIDISTAMPIVGPAIFCPSCYFDCRKWTVTDQSGFFKIDGLDSSLKFKVLVSAVGFQTTQSESCPVDGAQLKIALRPRRNRSNLGQMVTGLVRSEHGIAISGALVNPVSKIDSNGLRSSAGKGVGPAITDAEGRFEIDLVEGVRGIDLVVAANGFCSRKFVELTPSAVHKLELEVGAAVTGRVGNMGVPVEGVSVAVAQTDHSSYREKLFQKAVPMTTDAQGKLTFSI